MEEEGLLLRSSQKHQDVHCWKLDPRSDPTRIATVYMYSNSYASLTLTLMMASLQPWARYLIPTRLETSADLKPLQTLDQSGLPNCRSPGVRALQSPSPPASTAKGAGRADGNCSV